MRKRLTMALAVGALVAAMAPGVVSAAPNPDSAAGACGASGTSVGLGDDIGKLFIPSIKGFADVFGISVGQALQIINDGYQGFGIAEGCAPGTR
jgi:hypothetical protein